MQNGKLYLIPSPLGGNALHTIPSYVVEIIHKIEHIVAERAKTARRFIKATGTPRPMPTYLVSELNDRTHDKDLNEMLHPVFDGKDVGILSEAGCPGIADPGARLVALAHRKGVQVVPLVGPSSILLALMASGMNGQDFRFLGYLPAKVDRLSDALKKLEIRVRKEHQTQIFIEAPYRNRQVIEQALKVLSAETLFCIAADLTMESEFIATHTIGEWRKKGIPELHKRAAIFMIGR